MKHSTTNCTDVTIGLDLGDTQSQLCALDAAGEVTEEGRVRTTPEALRHRFGGMPSTRIAIETGTHSPWISRLLRKLGHEVIVANARELRLISENKNKTDKADAEYLARLARADPALLHPVDHRKQSSQSALEIIRARDSLVRARTSLINHVRGAVKSFGGRITGATAHSFHNKALESVPTELQEPIGHVLDCIGELSKKIKRFDKEIEKVGQEQYPVTQRLQQITGVGPLTALAFVLVLDDASRFRRSRTVGAYLGLTPRKDNSGKRNPELRITKAGDSLLRRLLVGSAHYILGPFGPDCDLRSYGESIAARGGKFAKKRAVVAVARKLAVLLHRLWVSGEEYEPLRATKIRKRLRRPKMSA